MTMLSVVTFTSGTRADWLQECTESIRREAFDEMTHAIVECRQPAQWAPMRLEMATAARYVAFVDDDDLVMGDSLRLCCLALEATGAGVAFTRQRMFHGSEPGQVYGTPPKRHGHIAESVQAVHHLAVMRRDALDKEALSKLADALPQGAGFDWALKANAAANGGAVHVPVVGYGWRVHSQQRHRDAAYAQAFAAASAELRPVMRAWFNDPAAAVPIWDPSCA